MNLQTLNINCLGVTCIFVIIILGWYAENSALIASSICAVYEAL